MTAYTMPVGCRPKGFLAAAAAARWSHVHHVSPGDDDHSLTPHVRDLVAKLNANGVRVDATAVRAYLTGLRLSAARARVRFLVHHTTGAAYVGDRLATCWLVCDEVDPVRPQLVVQMATPNGKTSEVTVDFPNSASAAHEARRLSRALLDWRAPTYHLRDEAGERVCEIDLRQVISHQVRGAGPAPERSVPPATAPVFDARAAAAGERD